MFGRNLVICFQSVGFHIINPLLPMSPLACPECVGQCGQPQADVSIGRGHKSQLSLSSHYVTLSARRYASQIVGIYEWQWHTHSIQAQVPVFYDKLVFFFFQERVWNERIYLETSNKPAALCVLNISISLFLCNLHPSVCTCPVPQAVTLYIHIRTPPCTLPKTQRWNLTSDDCLKIVCSLCHNFSFLSLRGTNISNITPKGTAIRSATNLEKRWKTSLIIACHQFLSPLFCGGVHLGHHSWLHLTHQFAVRRLTGTCARSSAGFLRHSEPTPAASLDWTGLCRLGKG